jgi:hypothetical protein
MRGTDNVGILTTDVKYVDIFKRAWCIDVEWINLAQENTECSKGRIQDCIKSRGSAVDTATMLRAEILLFSKRARPISASHPVSC